MALNQFPRRAFEGAATIQTFTGNGSNTSFTLSQTQFQNECFVYVNDVAQVPGTDFTINGTSLSFTVAPGSGEEIIVRGFGVPTPLNSVSDASITSAKLADSAITSTKLATGAIEAKLGYTPANQTDIQNQIDNLIDSAPGALDTLNELAAALGDDANFATTVTNSLATKAPIDNPEFTGSIKFPLGTVADRPSTPTSGIIRFNTDAASLEVYNGIVWSLIGANDGSSYAQAANNATEIYDLGIRGKGLFWVKKADGTPIQVYCDLDTLSAEDGKAGWMLVASWATASEWTKDSVSSSATFGATALNCFSSNFGNSNMKHMRVHVASSITDTAGASTADWYYYWNSPIQWKTAWANGAGTNNHYNSGSGVNSGSVQRNSLRTFNLSYNLKFGYKNTNQVWNNLSDGGSGGSYTGTEAWYDWYSGLTTPGYTLGVYNAGGSGRQDGTLGILPQGYTSDNTTGQDCNNNNAKYGYDDNTVVAWAGTSATNNLGANTGTQGSNTNMWMWIK